MVEDFVLFDGKEQPKFRRISSTNKGNSHLIERRFNHVRRTISARKDRRETQAAVASILRIDAKTLQENNIVNNLHNKQYSDENSKRKKKKGQVLLTKDNSSESKSPKSKLTVQSIGLGRHRSFTRIMKQPKNKDDADDIDTKSTKILGGSSVNNGIDKSKEENNSENQYIIDHQGESMDSILGIECLPATFLLKKMKMFHN